MARKMFTQEQVRVMAENPYTLHVSTTQITFTNAFKEEFWRRYQEGDTPRTIMYDLGYDPEVLGRNRLSGIQNVVCKQAVSANTPGVRIGIWCSASSSSCSPTVPPADPLF